MLILGLGNFLMGDEGVGVHAVRALEGLTMPPGITVPSNSPGTRPRLQTEVASGIADPAPWTSSQATTQSAMNTMVTMGVRTVWFSS